MSIESGTHSSPESPEDEYKVVDGVTYRKVDTGYTIRQYFSHSTPEKGPGPGWDYRMTMLPKLGIDPFTEDLPDDPYYEWQEVENE